MRKTTKGAIAVGAGVALLLGGAGTLAAWRVDAPLNGGTAQSVASGNLNLVANNDGKWFWGNATCDAPLNATVITIASVALVPGDCVVYQETVKVDAQGDNLQAAVITATPTITGTTGVTTALKANLTVGSTTSFGTTLPAGVTAGTGPTAGQFLFNGGAAGVTAHTISATGTVTMTVKFNAGSLTTANRDGALGTASISGASISIKQTQPVAAS